MRTIGKLEFTEKLLAKQQRRKIAAARAATRDIDEYQINECMYHVNKNIKYRGKKLWG